ncbi:Uncharacterised protein [Mycobacteroides abscessus]|nr:Uncharacterised protein [Mycobacteroides abscessus]
MLGAGARAGRVSDAQGWCIAIGKRNLHFACSSKHLRCRRFYAAVCFLNLFGRLRGFAHRRKSLVRSVDHVVCFMASGMQHRSAGANVDVTRIEHRLQHPSLSHRDFFQHPYIFPSDELDVCSTPHDRPGIAWTTRDFKFHIDMFDVIRSARPTL